MKKLMIAAAIVCAAVMAQASQVDWSVEWVYSDNATKGVDTYDTGSSVNYWIVNMLTATDTSGLGVDKSGNLVNKAGYATLDSGSFSESTTSTTPDGTVANGNYLAMVIYDSANKLYGVSYANQVSGIVDEPPTAGALAQNFQNDADFTNEGYMVASIAIEDVPEPTSGLLLLLGLSGLALRRKRA